jgi:hypothetical protein
MIDARQSDYLFHLWREAGFAKYGLTDAQDHASAYKNLLDQQYERQLAISHDIVSSFINCFARTGEYIVTFADNVKTARTDLRRRRVSITPAPVLDPTLDTYDAALVMTGLAVHEIAHERYGLRTAQAVARRFPKNALASTLSNLLDDVRIERRFKEDYPGYAHVFAPTLDYIGRSVLAKNGLVRPSLDKPLELAILAIRYPAYADWTADTAVERAWWEAWAERGTRDDKVQTHVQAVREALDRIAAMTRSMDQERDEPRSDNDRFDAQGTDQIDGRPDAAPSAIGGDPSDDGLDADPSAAGEDPSDDGLDADPSAAGEDPSDDGLDADPSAAGEDPSDDGLDADPSAAGEGRPKSGAVRTPTPPRGKRADQNELDRALNMATQNIAPDAAIPFCVRRHNIDEAAQNNGVFVRAIEYWTKEGDANVVKAKFFESDGCGHFVDVVRDIKSSKQLVPNSELATRYIRDALLQSRTGRTDFDPDKTTGRLVQRDLARVAMGNRRIFAHRNAPSVGRYAIWLMLDTSGSMWGDITEACQVARAIAEASISLPTVRLTVWAWGSRMRTTHEFVKATFVKAAPDANAVRLWTRGYSPTSIDRAIRMTGGGTPDSIVLRWAARAIKRNLLFDETPIIIFISDGLGLADMDDAVREARKSGVQVYGVSFGVDLTDEQLERRYGRDNSVTWAGSIIETSRHLAKLFSRIVAPKVDQ